MLGTTLEAIQSHIEALASADGTYSLVCARYGDRPVPTAGLRFETRAEARTAARATEQYGTALRVGDLGDGQRVRLRLTRNGTPTELVTARIDPEA